MKRILTSLILILWTMSLIAGSETEETSLIDKLTEEATSYYNLCDYSKSYEASIKVLDLCEQYDMPQYLPTIYTNIANIHYRFGSFDIARSYDLKALAVCRDTMQIVSILINLGGSTERSVGNIDSAFYYFNRALDISKRHESTYLDAIFTNIALYHQRNGRFVEAQEYFKYSLAEAVEKSHTESEAENLSYQGKLFMETGQRDSAMYYMELSNKIAQEYSHLWIIAENHLALSQVEEIEGHDRYALEHLKIYTKIKDSITNTGVLSNINELERIYDVSKSNRRIEQLLIDGQIKRRTSLYQTTAITMLVLACVVFLLLYRKLIRAYKALVAKNLSIIDKIRYKNSSLTGEMQRVLLDKILEVMEDTKTVCDTEFSLDKLAQLVNSNHAYVSQAINSTNKNFRSLLYDYRIREAQRLFLDPDTAKYTIETVAFMVGFKSRTAFRQAFIDISGVSPSFYIKSVKEELG